jgi:FAD dependent oxidoreductase
LRHPAITCNITRPSGAKRNDSIARSARPIELHSAEWPRLKWLLDDDCDIANDNLVPARGERLLVAGRWLSAGHEAMASARVRAQCFRYGQAIGRVAAMCLRNEETPRTLNVSDLREAPRKHGAAM